MKKKVISILCAVAMAASVFAGCGNGDNAEKKQDNSEQADVEENSIDSDSGDAESIGEELEYVELEWYFYTRQELPDVDMIQEKLDEYFLEKLNCKVNMHVYSESEYVETMPTMLLSGENIGIVYLNGRMGYTTLAEQGAFYPISNLMDQYGTNVRAMFKDEIWNAMTVKNDIYAIPTLKDNVYILGYLYNASLAEDIGVDPESWEWTSWLDCEADLLNAKALRDEIYPEYSDMPLVSESTGIVPYNFALERLDTSSVLACANIPGKNAVAGKSEHEVFNLYETDEYRELCLMKQRLVEAGVFAYDYTTFETSPSFMYSTLVMPAWGYTYVGEDLFSEEFDTKLVLFDDLWTDTANYTSSMTAIGANCNDPERAMMVLDLLNSDTYLSTLLHFGVEDVHWFRQDDGTITFEGGRNEDLSNAGWYEWYGQWAGNLAIVDGPESNIGPDGIAIERIAECNENATLPSHLGFVLDTTNISNELAACRNVIAEYTALNYGQYESQEAVNKAVDEFVEKLRANGSEKIVEDVQAQIDAWVAAQ